MIDKDWRRRLSVLSDRLGGDTPSLECQFALDKFRELQNPVPQENIPVFQDNTGINYDELVDKLVEKGIDTAILGAAIFNK